MIFSDKSNFNVFNNLGAKVQYLFGYKHETSNILQKVKQGEGIVIVLGAITYYGVSDLFFIKD
ncbi:hypothetical protein A0H76_1845 [Hepatospora eriocheir]|uniref:Uncharacterized protein n=1 Tax=Hepatospora eriocheir TaxID=1081669 RepID=A0A1X0QGD6_9MICR|nr:hypothetical protein A0H76_1845 [Hepatospora eriocheir]